MILIYWYGILTLYKLEFGLQVVAAITRWGGRVDVGHQLNITRRCNKKVISRRRD